MNIHFNCTQCTKCCQHTKIPVTVAESIDWLNDGNQIQVLCEASPWMPAEELKAAYLMQRSFAARSGTLPIRVTVTLIAKVAGNCPNLLPDTRCRIYERRPLVCRIYPAEINPFTQLDPHKKGCPPEAWSSNYPVLQRSDGTTVAPVHEDIQRFRSTNTSDIPAKQKLCAALNLTTAAVSQEAFFIYSLPMTDIQQALSALKTETPTDSAKMQWQLITDRDQTLARLNEACAMAAHPRDVPAGPYEFIGLKT